MKLDISEKKTKRMVLRGKPPRPESSQSSSPGPQKLESVAVFSPSRPLQTKAKNFSTKDVCMCVCVCVCVCVRAC